MINLYPGEVMIKYNTQVEVEHKGGAASTEPNIHGFVGTIKKLMEGGQQSLFGSVGNVTIRVGNFYAVRGG